MISAYERKCQERSKSEIRDRIFDSLLGSISGNSSNMALGIILLIALPFMMNGIFSVGEFVMFGYYYAFLAYLPDAIGNLVKRKKQTNASRIALDFCFRRQIVQALSGKKTDMIFRSVQAVERKCSMRRKKES